LPWGFDDGKARIQARSRATSVRLGEKAAEKKAALLKAFGYLALTGWANLCHASGVWTRHTAARNFGLKTRREAYYSFRQERRLLPNLAATGGLEIAS
jgi:hypothetical protein